MRWRRFSGKGFSLDTTTTTEVDELNTDKQTAHGVYRMGNMGSFGRKADCD